MEASFVEYKNFKVFSSLFPCIKHMEVVEESREKLNNLSQNWDNLSLLSQLGDAGVNMNKIKSNFTTLSSELINYLGQELMKKSVSEMNSKAQVAVDIVIRNLFERTADIGFLATDEMIREFLLQYNTKFQDGYEEEADTIRKRFIEYIDKYSVYFDIVLMNTNGDILTCINRENKLEKSKDSIIQETINTEAEYVETFKYHDFLPEHKQSLVYSYKVTKNNDSNSEVLGVLSLCFKFENEMEGVFSNLINKETKECLVLLDKNSQVIATSDKYHVGIGATLETVLNDSYKIISFGGRDYLAKTCETNGYQGFFGLGWYGHIMIPLEHAFGSLGKQDFEISEELLLAILQHGNQFSKRLKSIPVQADNIQYNLNRAIWNGHIKQSNSHNDNKQFSKALLQEIRKTGENTKDIIDASMANLTRTMVLGDSQFLADLILDIMDRNLYERANDCRWWALTPDFRKILEGNQISSEDRDHMGDILEYINNLYTVYTNLFVYDTHGTIIAVSDKKQRHLVGQRLSQKWVDKTLEITDPSKYYVSDFEETMLYDSQHTYIYNAPVLSLADSSKVVGGIGIVFDSEVEFETMIKEALPKKENGEIVDGLFSVITTKERIVIASNSRHYSSGDTFKVDSKFYKLKAGESISEIVNFNGTYYALGVQCSKGYREYKSEQDTYTNDVFNFVFSYISEVDETVVQEHEKFTLEKDIAIYENENTVDIASFMIGTQWLGIKATDVIESIGIQDLMSTVKMEEDHHFKGTAVYRDTIVSVIDIRNFIKEEIVDEYQEIVIVKFGDNGYIGLLVNSLRDIPEVDTNSIKPLNEYVIGNGTLIQSVVFPKDTTSKDVLSILSIEKLSTNLVEPYQTHMVPKLNA